MTTTWCPGSIQDSNSGDNSIASGTHSNGDYSDLSMVLALMGPVRAARGAYKVFRYIEEAKWSRLARYAGTKASMAMLHGQLPNRFNAKDIGYYRPDGELRIEGFLRKGQ